MLQQWTSGRTRARGSGHGAESPGPEESNVARVDAGIDKEVDESSEPDRERPRPEALESRNDGEQGNSEQWGGWSRTTPGSWYGSGQQYGSWWDWHWDDWSYRWQPRRDEKVARVEETTWAMDGR